MKLKRTYYFAILIVVFLCSCQQQHWLLTLMPKGKKPYDAYLALSSLQQFAPKANINRSGQVFDKQYISNRSGHECKLIIAETLNYSSRENEALKNYVSSGGTVFLSANHFDIELLQDLSITIKNKFRLEALPIVQTKDSLISNINIDTIQQAYCFAANYDSSRYRFIGNYPGAYLDSIDQRVTIDTLGYNADGSVHFFRIRYGKGNLYIHLAPVCFSNYFLLQQNNYQYLSTLYSFIDPKVKTIYWYSGAVHIGMHMPQASNQNFNLSVLFRYPMLKAAFMLLLLACVLFLLVNAKRKQRYIPVKEPLQNNSLDFVETLGKLYYNVGNHKNLANKMTNHFWEFLRTRYHISKQNDVDALLAIVVPKTGVETQLVKKVLLQIQVVEQTDTLNDKAIKEFFDTLQSFYKSAK